MSPKVTGWTVQRKGVRERWSAGYAEPQCSSLSLGAGHTLEAGTGVSWESCLPFALLVPEG